MPIATTNPTVPELLALLDSPRLSHAVVRVRARRRCGAAHRTAGRGRTDQREPRLRKQDSARDAGRVAHWRRAANRDLSMGDGLLAGLKRAMRLIGADIVRHRSDWRLNPQVSTSCVISADQW